MFTLLHSSKHKWNLKFGGLFSDFFVTFCIFISTCSFHLQKQLEPTKWQIITLDARMAFPQLSTSYSHTRQLTYTIISLIIRRPKAQQLSLFTTYTSYLHGGRFCESLQIFLCSIACWWPCRKAIICNMIISVFSFHFKLFETVTIISGKIYLPITC